MLHSEPSSTGVVQGKVPDAPEPSTRPNFDRDVVAVMGLPVDRLSLQEAVDRLCSCIDQAGRCFLSTPNTNFVIQAGAIDDFRLSVQQSDLSLPDGMPIVWIARAMGLPMPGRVAGSDLFQWLCEGRGSCGRVVRIYLYGGPPGAASTAAKRINECYSAVQCVGYEEAGFGSVDDLSSECVMDRINAARPDFLLIALGARKGQAWIQRNRDRLTAPVISHLGAVVNFAAGTLRRAPRWMQYLGVEWAWRINEEPMLWRRYAKDAWALSGFLLTGVLPYIMQRASVQFVRRLKPAEGRIAWFAVGEDAWIEVSGHLDSAQSAELARALDRAWAHGGGIVVDLGQALSVDPAIVAKFMLLDGAARQAQRRWCMKDVPVPVRRTLRYLSATYLLIGIP